MNLRNILIYALRGRILPFFTRLRMLLNPTFLIGRIAEKIRHFMRVLLDVRPRSKDDYYPMARWLVSKRLAYAIVIIVGIICTIYILSSRTALFPGRTDSNIKTYK